MKKFLVLAALALFSVGFATQASAIKLVSEPLKWRVSNSSVLGGATFSSKKPIAVGVTDTSATWSTDGWAFPNAAFADSVVIGWVCIGIDTTVAYSPTATSFTVNLDTGNVGANVLNMGTTGAVTFTDPTTTDRLVKIPIYKDFTLARGKVGVVDNFGPLMRMRIVGIGGVWSAATISVLHWAD